MAKLQQSLGPWVRVLVLFPNSLWKFHQSIWILVSSWKKKKLGCKTLWSLKPVIPCMAAHPHFCAFLGLTPASWLITSVHQACLQILSSTKAFRTSLPPCCLRHIGNCQHQCVMLLYPLLIMLLCNIVLPSHTWGLSLSTLKDLRVQLETLLQSSVASYLMSWTEGLHEVCNTDLQIFKEQIMIHSILSWHTLLPPPLPKPKGGNRSTMWDPSAEMSNGQSG